MHETIVAAQDPQDGLVIIGVSPTLQKGIVLVASRVTHNHFFRISIAVCQALVHGRGLFLAYNPFGAVRHHDIEFQGHIGVGGGSRGRVRKVRPHGLFQRRHGGQVLPRQRKLKQDLIARVWIVIPKGNLQAFRRVLFAQQNALGIPQGGLTIHEDGKLVPSNGKIIGGTRI